jgi:methyl-accepting chemotaxis protein
MNMKEKRWSFKSLRSVVLIGGLLCAVVPAAILGISSAYAVRSLIVGDAIDRGETSAADLAARLNEYLDERMHVASNLADTLGTQANFDQPALGPWLAMTRKNFPVFTRLIVVNLKDVQVADEPLYVGGKSSLGAKIAAMTVPLGREALRDKHPIIDHAVSIGILVKTQIIRIVIPMFGKSGVPRGFLLALVDAGKVQEFVERQQHEASGRVEVAAENGHVIASQDPTFLQRQFNFSRQLPAFWRTLNQSTAGRITSFTDERGEERLGGYATVPLVNWKVWVSRTIPQINREVSATYRSGLVWLTLVLGFAVAATLLLTRVIVRPIDALRKTANEIAAGNLDRRAPEASLVELATLGRSINHMAESLQGSLETERTAKTRLERSVRAYAELAARVTEGDLAARVIVDDQNDELGMLGTSLNQMAESLERLVDEIRAAAASLASATTEILAATSQQVSSATEEATAVRQTAATVLEVRQTAEQATRKTKLVAELAQRVEETAERGRRSVEESISGSEGAKVRMEALAAQILAFSEQAQAIGEINAAVAELAQQSNLLAVNAAIEAAKAGEASKGFAVVATEVKELGARSKEATVQVRRIVGDIQKSAQNAVMAAEQGVKIAEAGSTVAQRSGEAMEVLAASISEASEAAQQINASAEQQQAGMDQIALAMENIEQASAQTVAATQQVERAANDLNQLAQTLNGTIRSATGKGKVAGAVGV